jgi:Carbohydrate family 9 binding domain-like
MSKTNRNSNDSTVVSLYTKSKPVIDGKMDNCWVQLPAYVTSKVLWGTVHNTANHIDIEGKLRSLWDKDYLYFLVEVNDDKIIKQSYNGNAFDYGWIEDARGRKVWSMDRNNSRYAGGAQKNRYADTTIALSEGSYFLCYKSDESHAFGQWDDDPPLKSPYGIQIRLLKTDKN